MLRRVPRRVALLSAVVASSRGRSVSSAASAAAESATSSPAPSPTAAPKLRISEIFSSVQGEGPFTGRPAVFLRLGLCNLECIWCDTKYTWLYDEGQLRRLQATTPTGLHDKLGGNVYSKDAELRRADVAGALQLVQSHARDGGNVRAVVITGGEPLLHKKALLSLCERLQAERFHIEVETNGTLDPTGLPSAIHYNVSPKLSNSHQPAEKRLKPDILRRYASLPSVLKFVVSGDGDLRELREVVAAAGFPPDRVYLMPEGTTTEELASRGRWLVPHCLQLGYRYSHRLHVSLWGDKRGV